MDVLKEISKDVALRELSSLKALVKTVGRKYEKQVIQLFSYLWKRGEILTQSDLNNVVDLVHLAFLYTKTKSKESALRIASDIIRSRSINDTHRKVLYKVFEDASLLFTSESSNDENNDNASSNDNNNNDSNNEDIRKVISNMVEKSEKEKTMKKQENENMRQVFAIAQKVFNMCGFEGTAPKAFAMALRPKLHEFNERIILSCAEIFRDRNAKSQFTWKYFISQINALVPLAKISLLPITTAKKTLVEKLYNSLTLKNDRITIDSYIFLFRTPYIIIKRKIDELRTLQDVNLVPRLQTLIERAYKEFKSLPKDEQTKCTELSRQLLHEDLQKHKIPVPPPAKKTKPEVKDKSEAKPEVKDKISKKEDKFMKQQNINKDQQKVTANQQNVHSHSSKDNKNSFTRFAKWAMNLMTFIIDNRTQPKTTPIDRESTLTHLRALSVIFSLGPSEKERVRKVLIKLLSEISTPRIKEYLSEVKDKISFRLATSKDFKELSTDLFGSIDIIKNRTDLTDEDFVKVVVTVLFSSLARYLMLTKFPPSEDTKKPINQGWEERKKKIEEYKQILHSLPSFEEKFNFVMKILMSEDSKLKSAEEVLRG